MDVYCYSQRLLNPFRGTVNVIKYQSAEAVTTDGLHWDIYVSNDELTKDLDEPVKVQTSDIRYGSWSAEKGLKRGPLYPSDDFARMEQMGDIVFQHLLDRHRQLPFPFADHYELWLLDKKGQPLALIDSVVNEDEIDLEHLTRWRSGKLCRQNFSSEAADVVDTGDDHSAAQVLDDYIDSLLHSDTPCQWFYRQQDGTGIGLTQSTECITAEHFPPLLLRTEGHAAPYQQLINDFIHWQAPWLLLLDSIDEQMRQVLEQAARSQAVIIEQQYRHYPHIINADLIKSARVEAQMRNSLPVKTHDDDTMPTYYIEMYRT